MTQYLLADPHDSDEEPTMETMEPAELEAAMAATGCDHRGARRRSGAFVFAGGLSSRRRARSPSTTPATSLSAVSAPFVEAPEYVGRLLGHRRPPTRTPPSQWAAKASKALGGRIEVRAFQVTRRT